MAPSAGCRHQTSHSAMRVFLNLRVILHIVFAYAALLPVILEALLEKTSEPWELVLVFDGCKDESIPVALQVGAGALFIWLHGCTPQPESVLNSCQ